MEKYVARTVHYPEKENGYPAILSLISYQHIFPTNKITIRGAKLKQTNQQSEATLYSRSNVFFNSLG